MFKRVRLTVAAILIAEAAFSQTGLRITIVDKKTKEPLPFTAVGVEKNGVIINSGAADINGIAEIKPLDPDKYDVRVQLEGYHPYFQAGVQVDQDVMVRLTVEMSSTMDTSIKQVTVIGHTKPPILSTDTRSGGVEDSAGIHARADQSITGIITTTPGVIANDVGGDVHIRGGRSEDNLYIVDGQKITADQENGGIPNSIIDQVSVVTGGTPAKYGDVTGGVIEIHTLSGATKFFGSVQGLSSEPFDAFGYNDANFSFGGPLLWKKDSLKNKKFPILDFIAGGEFTYQKDASPSFIGDYYANSSTLTTIQNNPLTINPSGGFNRSAEYVTDNDIDHSNYIQNDPSTSYSLNVKLNYHLNENVKITLGGSYQFTSAKDFTNVYEIYDYAENPLDQTTNEKAFIRLTQKFYSAGNKDKNALIKNAYYSIQGEYSHYYNVVENAYFKENTFDYGYVGQFYQYRTPFYGGPRNGSKGVAYYMQTYQDSLYTFTPSSLNSIEANYTSDVYKSLGQAAITNENTVQENLGLLNGDRPGDVYSLWYNVGRAYGGYQKKDFDHYRFSAEFNAEIAHNSIEVGFEYEQNNDSYYDINAVGLWTLMRQITDFPQLASLDTTKPILVKSGTYAYYNYDYSYNASAQTQFDKSLRAKLGLAANSTTWIQTDDYAPSMYSLDMFSASDLLNNGSQYVSYFGYDYKGDLMTSSTSINDFFNKKDANGNLYYPMAPYSPIYMAGYIQDHFDIKNIVFDVGVRVDQFNANEPELKDPYLLFPGVTAGEVRSRSSYYDIGNVASTIGDNYIVYVNSTNSPSAILGYRNGKDWYNAQGDLIPDPTVMASQTTTGTIQPLLENKTQTQVDANSFTNYTPQVNVMPRIAFSFPITDRAKFFAHYDVLTQRPPSWGYNIFQATTYLYTSNLLGGTVANPALTPQQTTDYELGFSQVLNEEGTMALTFSAFYREMRDEIQAYKYLDAYPVSYVAYNNVDFGTVKGLAVSFDLRQSGEWSDVKMRASYNLQFANGTGSGPNDGYNLAASGEPNLAIPQPLSYDQRHTFTDNLDFHFGSGPNYDGPVWRTHSGKSVQVLSNAGININFTAGSGTPYTAYSNVFQQGIGLPARTGFVGSLNGEYLPWQYRMDARLDKMFNIMVKSHRCNLSVYIEATNLLNTENILQVYPYTGSPTDDGFLASAIGKQTVPTEVSPQAFTDQYVIKEKVTSPSYFALPRQARLGVIFNF